MSYAHALTTRRRLLLLPVFSPNAKAARTSPARCRPYVKLNIGQWVLEKEKETTTHVTKQAANKYSLRQFGIRSNYFCEVFCRDEGVINSTTAKR